MKAVFMPGGYAALVDDEDFELISSYDWHAEVSADKQNLYAVSKGRLMHRLIIRPKNWQTIDHINQNGLDNQRRNLKLRDRRVKTSGTSQIPS